MYTLCMKTIETYKEQKIAIKGDKKKKRKEMYLKKKRHTVDIHNKCTK